MLPRTELDRLLMAVIDAVGLASKGNFAYDDNRLVAGLRRAEKALADGEPWADELVQCYRMAIDHYAARYGIRWEATEVRWSSSG